MKTANFAIAIIAAMLGCGGNSSHGDDAPPDGGADAPADADEPGTGPRIRVMAFGVRAPAVLELAIGGDARELVVTEDGLFRFPGRYADGASYAVTTTDARCRIPSGTGTLATTDAIVEIYCDGVVELASVAFSVPMTIVPAFDPVQTSYVLRRPFLLEPTDPIAITATARYPALATLDVYGAPASSGVATAPHTLGPGPTITLRHTSGLERTYVLAATATQLRQEAYVKPTTPQMDGTFGGNVRNAGIALDRDTLVVGAGRENADAGAVYVFRRSVAGVWTQEARLTPATAKAGARFGTAVAISGDLLVVGAAFEDIGTTASAGAAYIFQRTGTTWNEVARVQAPVTSASALFGLSTAIAGATIAVGAPGDDLAGKADAGQVHVFVQSGTAWPLQQSVAAPNADAGDGFGTSVALSADTLLVGAPTEDGSASSTLGSPNNTATDAGAAYVFVRSGTTWPIERYLKASDASATDNFGASVAIDGDLAVVGAPKVDLDAAHTNTGAAYVESRSGTAWSELATLRGTQPLSEDKFGIAVDVDANHIVVGVDSDDSSALGVDAAHNTLASDAGAVYVFRGTGADWSVFHFVKASNPDAGDRFGNAVAVDGDTFAVGAPLEDSSVGGIDTPGGQGNASASFNGGAAYIFR